MLANDLPVTQFDSLDSQKVLRTNLGYRAVENGCAAGTLAYLPRKVRSQLRIWSLIHHLEGLLDLFVRDNAQEGRLFQLHGQPLPERSIEDRVASRVREISKNDGVSQ